MQSFRLVGLASMGLFVMAMAAGAPASGQGRSEETKTLYLFLSSDSRGAPDAARRAVGLVKESKGAIRLRPVILLHDFTVLKQADERSPFFRAVKEMNRLGTLSIPLYDLEGLALAERWKIKVVPTFVLVGSGRAHIVSGAGADLKALVECKE